MSFFNFGSRSLHEFIKLMIVSGKKKTIVCHVSTYLIENNLILIFCRRMNTLETHTRSVVQWFDDILQRCIFRSAAFLVIFSLKQTFVSDAFFFFFSSSFSSAMLLVLFLIKQTLLRRESEREKKAWNVSFKRSPNWLTKCRQIEIHTHKFCNWSRLFEYSLVWFDCPKSQRFFSSSLPIDWLHSEKKHVKKYTNILTLFTHLTGWWPVSIKVLSVRAINGRCLSMSNRGIITPYCLLIDFEERK